jgi:hypothetical protein
MNLKIKKWLSNNTVLFSIFLILMMSYAWWRSSSWYKKAMERTNSSVVPTSKPQMEK